MLAPSLLPQAFHPIAAGLGFGVPPRVFWPYFSGTAILLLGLAAILRPGAPRPHGRQGIFRFAPLCFAIPMAIFGAEHFTVASAVATLVPSWIPGHLFWVYFVGVALLAAALSLAVKRLLPLSSALLGLMILLFVLLIAVPSWFSTHDNVSFTLVLRDSVLGSCSCAFAASLTPQWGKLRTRGVITVTRFLVAGVMVVYGVDHLLYPYAAPGIPPQNTEFNATMPSWIPAHAVWARATGALLIACALGLASRKLARVAATTLGVIVLVLIALVYVPLAIARASSIGTGLNYLAIHFALAGAALLLAAALPGPLPQPVNAARAHAPSITPSPVPDSVFRPALGPK